MENQGPSLAMRAVALLVLLVAGYILLRVVIGMVAGIAWMILLVVLVVGLIWAWRTLRA
jgi:hypothetical protein